jgi:hypothetical protein
LGISPQTDHFVKLTTSLDRQFQVRGKRSTIALIQYLSASVEDLDNHLYLVVILESITSEVESLVVGHVSDWFTSQQTFDGLNLTGSIALDGRETSKLQAYFADLLGV